MYVTSTEYITGHKGGMGMALNLFRMVFLGERGYDFDTGVL